ncbi:type I-G CRISPR-associated protein, Cas3-extension family [Craterilacuibacter sinensis]|uniref:Uncharacterized protein n=1 Tax=Craterilacuibacter sinensis TaxID=2686017 RepID=A0A845BIV3_9NEIS|nr:hypothetical protein [Craterilacuibacter sinensis]MXR36112.1 hypothetical protein [Craterilacuibacter sinensis]
MALSWQQGYAELEDVDGETLRECLLAHMRGCSRAPEFNFMVQTDSAAPCPVQHLCKISPADYQTAAQAMADDQRALGFLAGFATDTVVGNKGFVSPTAFDFSSGNQKLAQKFCGLAALLDPDSRRGRKALPTEVLLEAALLGGVYARDQHSLGWDPVILKSHGYAGKAPTNDTQLSQPWLTWLAVESLPWHPLVPDGNNRAVTTGWRRGGAYLWPEWTCPLTAPEVRLLRARPVDTLGYLPGVQGVWLSRRIGVGEFNFFAPATRT